jgi:hypothetical protein
MMPDSTAQAIHIDRDERFGTELPDEPRRRT